MRLLNTQTLDLRFFQDGDAPPYAALSLVHEDDEVSYADFEEMKALNILGGDDRFEFLKKRQGYHKVRGACELALRQSVEWIWIDECCMDWPSRMEVNENVNLAYERFRSTKKAYVYLADVLERRESLSEVGPSLENSLAKSKWFRRSWTVQELLAPSTLEFYNKEWRSLGDRASLALILERITGISHVYMRGAYRDDPRSAPCAEKLSWVAHRESSILENHVYAIVGLFNIKMDISYSEGMAAYYRFKRELLKICDGTVLFKADALAASKQTLVNQLGQSPDHTDTFSGFKTHSMLEATMNGVAKWEDLREHALEIAKNPPFVVDDRWRFTTICRKFHNQYVAWTLSTQVIGGAEYAICVPVTPIRTLFAATDVSGDQTLTISARPLAEVYHVRKHRLRGFKLCHLYLPIDPASSFLKIFK